jgi:hypothetical protein
MSIKELLPPGGKRKQRTAEQIEAAAPFSLDYPATQVGTVGNVTVAYDPALGAQGLALAQQLFNAAISPYNAMETFFGIPGGTVEVVIASLSGNNDGSGGAYHYGCDFNSGGVLYLDATFASTTVNPFRLEVGLYVAELSECFMGAQNHGWGCGYSNGEGLSRFCAEQETPAGTLNAFVTGPAWANAGFPDWISRTEPTDRDKLSTGCAIVYLYWMRSLGFTISQIVMAGGATLSANYQTLTGKTTAYQDLLAALKGLTVTSDNPFAPSGPATSKLRTLLYDRAAGQADIFGFDALGKVTLDTPNIGWRTSWDLMVAGTFLGNGQTEVLLYDRNAGQADVVAFDGSGKVSLDNTNSGWRTSWNLIVAGNFVGNGRSQILLYDRNAGQADVVGFDASGKTNLDTTASGWRNTWDMAVAGNFLGNGQTQVLLYDRNGGAGALIGFDATGKVNLDPTFNGWRTSWDLIAVGNFVGNGRDQILLYDRNAGQADVVGFDGNGKQNLDATNSGWRTSWNLIVSGKFVGNGRSQILLYDRDAGHADVVGFNNVGKEVNLDTGNDGWLTGWDVIVTGNFLQNGRDQILLYDRTAGQADVVGFDTTGKTNLDTVNFGLRTTFDTMLVL